MGKMPVWNVAGLLMAGFLATGCCGTNKCSSGNCKNGSCATSGGLAKSSTTQPKPLATPAGWNDGAASQTRSTVPNTPPLDIRQPVVPVGSTGSTSMNTANQVIADTAAPVQRPAANFTLPATSQTSRTGPSLDSGRTTNQLPVGGPDVPPAPVWPTNGTSGNSYNTAPPSPQFGVPTMPTMGSKQ